jgi:hypothetical protein
MNSRPSSAKSRSPLSWLPPLGLALALVLLAVPAAGLAKPDGGGKSKYSTYASCSNGKPFKAAKHCGYDGGAYFRGTFVFKSRSGKHPVKSCFRVYGKKPLGGGHACVKLKPLAYKAYPFKITGIRQAFSVKVTWFVNDDGKGFHQVGSSFLEVDP